MSKYKNIRYNGSDSKREAKRKQELELLERSGAISDLNCQVPFELIPAQYEYPMGDKGKRGRCLERACSYIADFVYMKDGERIVEDVKGYKGGGAYSVYTIKRKLMLERYGIRIKEV